MFNENDIYLHFMKGGSSEDLHKALENEIHNAQDRIDKEKTAALKRKELADKINKAKSTAFTALKSYFALVNPSVDDKIINSVLDTLETVEIRVNGARDKMPSILYDIFKLL